MLSGVATGMESAVYSALLIGAVVCGAFLLGAGNATIALFAVAMAGTGLLTTVGVIVSMDSFGPVTDNAQGIAEMSGDVKQPLCPRQQLIERDRPTISGWMCRDIRGSGRFVRKSVVVQSAIHN